MFPITIRKFLAAGALALTLIPAATGAASDATIPEFNPLCWEEAACEAARAQLSPEARDTKGWIQDSPCTGKFGKCLPAGVMETQIAFGGRRQFLHLGDFIQQMYKFAIGIAGLLSVVMLIVAGVQWITSGGNSEQITSAKKRIGGAMMGLFLAYLSYFILNVLNPALVQFRLPQVWMVRSEVMVPDFCSAASSSVFAFVEYENNQAKPVDLKKISASSLHYNYSFPKSADAEKNAQLSQAERCKDEVRETEEKLNKQYEDLQAGKAKVNDLNAWAAAQVRKCQEDFACGRRFVIKDGGSTACFGDVCPSGRACINIDFSDPANTNYHCEFVGVFGRITDTYLIPPTCAFKSGYLYPYLGKNGQNRLRAVCQVKNNTIILSGDNAGPTIKAQEVQTKLQIFKTDGWIPPENICERINGAKETKLLGFGLTVTISEPCGGYGKLFLINRLGQELAVIQHGANQSGGSDSYYVAKSLGAISDRDLFSREEIRRGGKEVNINVTMFPDQD